MKAFSLFRSFSAALTVAGVAAAAACSSYTASPDDGGSGEPGARGGPCYPNATCNAGLRCEGGVCVSDEAPRDASDLPDVNAKDGSSDASSSQDGADAAKPIPCDRTDTAEPPGVVDCEIVSCINQSVCCGTGHACNKPCMDQLIAMACDSSDDCPGGSRCCGSHGNSATDKSVCPRKNASPVLLSNCATACNANEFDLCTQQSQCGLSRRCTRLDATIAGASFSLGICE
ncbi:MAG: hypothetical protein U0174_14285 [Polyangiaceae bacterium]